MQGNWQQSLSLCADISSWLCYWLACREPCSALHAGGAALFFL